MKWYDAKDFEAFGIDRGRISYLKKVIPLQAIVEDVGTGKKYEFTGKQFAKGVVASRLMDFGFTLRVIRQMLAGL
jgi:hypothetical protein